MRYLRLFKIRKEERPAALVAAVYFAIVNTLMVCNFAHIFLSKENGHWSQFIKHFVVSGFDPITYSVMTEWTAGYNVYRHPLLAFFVWPFSMLNQGLIALLGVNLVQILVALLLVAMATYTFLFLYRIEHEIIGLRHRTALLLSAFCFSFGYVTLSFAVPDHFGPSMFLLVTALYISGKCLQKGRRLNIVQTVLLFFFTAGVSLNNGLKIFLDALFVNGRSFFRPKYLLLTVIVPSALMWGFARWEYRTFVHPKEMERKVKAKEANERQQQRVIQAFRDTTHLRDTSQIRLGYERVLAQKDSIRKARREQKAVYRHSGKPIAEGEFSRWTDITTPRWASLVENFFGESLQIHEDHLLGDTLRSRPVIVTYNYWVNYIVEALIVLFFLAGIWCGRRERFLWMAVAGMLLDMVLHVGLGFGLNEVYIMTAHWAFVLPIAIGYLFRSLACSAKSLACRVKGLLYLLALFLFVWNLALIIQFVILY